MKMVPYDREKLMFPRHYRRTKNLQILEDFMNGNADCVQLVDHGHTNAKNCQSCLYNSIVRFGITGVKVVIREGNVFLVKVEP